MAPKNEYTLQTVNHGTEGNNQGTPWGVPWLFPSAPTKELGGCAGHELGIQIHKFKDIYTADR